MTPRQKRNLTLAKQRRIEKTMARLSARAAEINRVQNATWEKVMEVYGLVPNPEWFGQSPRGVTVQ